MGVNGLVVMIAAFQAAERGSIPRSRINDSTSEGTHFFWPIFWPIGMVFREVRNPCASPRRAPLHTPSFDIEVPGLQGWMCDKTRTFVIEIPNFSIEGMEVEQAKVSLKSAGFRPIYTLTKSRACLRRYQPFEAPSTASCPSAIIQLKFRLPSTCNLSCHSSAVSVMTQLYSCCRIHAKLDL